MKNNKFEKQKRNHTNSTSCDNCGTPNIGGSKHKPNIG